MSWVLIIIAAGYTNNSNGGVGVSTNSVAFATEKLCKTAATQVDNMDIPGYSSKIETVCVRVK